MTLKFDPRKYDADKYFELGTGVGIQETEQEKGLIMEAWYLWQDRVPDGGGMPADMSEYMDLKHLLSLVMHKQRKLMEAEFRKNLGELVTGMLRNERAPRTR